MKKTTVIKLIAQLRNNNFLSKEVFTLSEMCSYTGFEKSFVIRKCSLHQIPHYNPVGKHLFFDKREIVSWLKREPIVVQNENTEKDLLDEILEKLNRKN